MESRQNLKVAFDSTAFARPQYGGIARYFAALARELNAIQGVSATIYSPLYRNEYARKLTKGTVRGVHLPTVPRTGLFIERASNLLSDLFHGFGSNHVVHETGYLRNRSNINGNIHIVTVFDMISELIDSENSYHATKLKRDAVERADHVLCISKKTQNDLVTIFGVDIKKTSVTYLGFDRQKIDENISVNKGRPFILFVGGRSNKYKNFKKLLQAYAEAEALNRNFDLICFGGEPLNLSELGEFETLRGRVIQARGSDSILAQYYAKASALVCPSIYEGFGLPLLEAMSMGCPVVASNVGSIPEVVGHAAELFDPTDEEAMRAAICNVVFDGSRSAWLSEEGRNRSGQFSWESCAGATLEAYLTVIKKIR